MRMYPALAAAILAGIISIGTAGEAHSAKDNTAIPAATPAPFDHKSLGKDSKNCVKCHKLQPPVKK